MNKKRFVSASAGGVVRPQRGWEASSLQDEVLPAGGLGVGGGRKLGCEARRRPWPWRVDAWWGTAELMGAWSMEESIMFLYAHLSRPAAAPPTEWRTWERSSWQSRMSAALWVLVALPGISTDILILRGKGSVWWQLPLGTRIFCVKDREMSKSKGFN